MRYFATRTDEGVEVRFRAAGMSVLRDLNPRLDLMNHSPSGFEYGYAGSGPAQLALAILAEHLKHHPEDVPLAQKIGRHDEEKSTDQLAVLCHQAFKFAVITPMKGDKWELTSEQVREALQKLANAK